MYVQESIKSIASTALGKGAGGLTVAPRELVCGLARCTGVPEARATTIVHAAVAADARARLLQIAVELRVGHRDEARQQMAALGAILTAFPLPDAAPEAELVGAGLRDKFTTAEMETVLKELVRPGPVLLFSNLNKLFFGYFDPENIFFR